MGFLNPKLYKSKLNKSEQGEAEEKGERQPGKGGLGAFPRQGLLDSLGQMGSFFSPFIPSLE